MKKILIAVCDMDGSYGKKLGEWISLQRGERITSVSFSSPECFLEYHNCTKQDIVLLGRGFYDNPQIREEISVNAGETLWVYLHDGEDEVQVADSICSEWKTRFKNSEIGYTDYDSLYDSFREKIFGIF